MLFKEVVFNRIIWPMIIEKAFALFYNKRYSSLDGGYVDIGLSELTNGAVFRHNLIDLKLSGNALIMIWDRLLFYFEKNYMICAGTIKSETRLPLSLIEEHAYIITKVIDIDSEKLIEITTSDQNQLLGSKSEWNIGSNKWSRRIKKAVKMINLNRNANNLASEILINLNEKSAFWISYEEFIKYFNSFYACKIINYNEIEELRFSDKWMSGFDGGCSNFRESFLKNPQYKIILEDSCNLIIQLHLIVNSIQVMHSIGFELFSIDRDLNQVKTEDLDSLNSIATNIGGYTKSKIISLDINLSKGCYILIPTTFFPLVHFDFLLRIWVEKNHERQIKIFKIN